ncbi:Multifunctional methyltransferase subunit TRM112-like protein [Oopsacas minuta]|uniref:Multifunctional methyltransferase subunit TRM112-like protein n=1 Tax=Oopsacas minuta TaxID=111878 RepID=A0AAV7KF57_9METZ|nr:Multifunctional methyltransferase subunit TRM112-like protein [Oopsacas minuta]
MKLITHNILQNNMKDGKKGYPLVLQATKIDKVIAEFNQEFLLRMLDRLEYHVLIHALEMIGMKDFLPIILPENCSEDEAFMKNLHHALLEIDIIEGELICPESGRKFPIKDGIPNMLLTDEEEMAVDSEPKSK